MQIAILGLGYVGMTAAACLASQGHKIVGVDPNDTKVATILSGKSPIREPGLDELIEKALVSGCLTAQSAIDEKVAECRLAIVCVGTPSAADGSHNMSFIAEVSRQLAVLLSKYPDKPFAVAYRSTCRPGTIEDLIYPIFEEVLGNDVDRVELLYNPEFLRESSAIDDFFSPPKIVIGTKDCLPSAVMDEVNVGLDAPTFYVSFKEAEITKFVDNTFHAVKISFANEIGRVCAKLGISTKEVHRIFVSDTKLNISKYYLRPGGAFGGSCLPKDVRALQHMSRQVSAGTSLINSLMDTNDNHKNFIFQRAVEGVPEDAKVLLMGIAFKNHSDDLRESPNIDLARLLIDAGYELSIFDPYVAAGNLVGQNLGALSSLPAIRGMLKTADEIAAEEYDLVIDTRGIANDYRLSAKRVIDVHALD